MSILRANTIDLKQTGPLTQERSRNSALNKQEALDQKSILDSYPRRFVFELTNACNLRCVMCGRNSAQFKATFFNRNWLDIFDHASEKVEEVTLMGWGEPTVHPEFSHFLHWAYKNGLRKYFCTNGMRLDNLFSDIFNYHTDIIAISLDGADKETNNRIRAGSDFDKIISSLRRIVKEKNSSKISFPYMNFVFTAMRSNFRQIPDMVRLASDIGLEEVKVVYLTVFDERLQDECLYDHTSRLEEVFSQAEEVSKELSVSLKLPHIRGCDPAGNKAHKDCFTAWRDFFLGSDGYVRSCMSTADKLFHIEKYASFDEMWNSPEFEKLRTTVNGPCMPDGCRNCYQSSYANWNRESSFKQIGNKFSPDWSSNT